MNDPLFYKILDRVVDNYPSLKNTRFEKELRQLRTTQQVEDYLFKISGNEADGEDRSWAQHIVQLSK